MKILTWIVVSDGASCRIFQHSSGQEKIDLIESFVGRHEPDSEIFSDKAGRTFDRIGKNRHRLEPKHSPHERLKENFAIDIIKILESSCENKAFDQLIIVCPPTMLGRVRFHTSSRLKNLMVEEISKDLTHESPIKIFNELREALLPVESMKKLLEVSS